uniref:class I SAM-dependent methyltransferase n=1 Tax=Chamaesiphon sp. OTE_20_metabat_361 TaxID=2964689 RepID=UPI0037BEAF13
ISNSLVHHLPEPYLLFQEIKRLIKLDGAILIRDLIRPENERIVNELAAKFGSNYDPQQQQLFQDSLKAALTLAEVRELIDRVGLIQVKLSQTSELHWTIERQKNIIDRI